MSKLNTYLQEVRARLDAIEDEPEWDIYCRNVCFYKTDKEDNLLNEMLPKTNELFLNESNQNGDHLGADLVGHREPNRSSYTVRTAWFLLNSRTDVGVLLKMLEIAMSDAEDGRHHYDGQPYNTKELESLIPQSEVADD